MSQPQPPTTEQVDAYIRTRLALAGFDLEMLPETPDAETGVPTRAQALASLRTFVTTSPVSIAGWIPPAAREPAPAYAQQAAAPLLYPSITESWTGKADAK
ncbi:hypothetical protein ACFXAZ_16805 [Streptomyces sp. NPDC059477]|uniref:hypothetical protein n=1 Tax=Streptomyces sp. NPDC059477 TaxID=3346847 RepID=UPI00367B8AA8